MEDMQAISQAAQAGYKHLKQVEGLKQPLEAPIRAKVEGLSKGPRPIKATKHLATHFNHFVLLIPTSQA